MSQKNETAVLVLALLITAGLLAGGFWWLTRRSGINVGENIGTQPTATPSPSVSNPNGLSSPEKSNSSNFASVQNVPSGLFNYGGSTSWAPIRAIADPKIETSHPEFRLRYVGPTSVAPGSSSGIRMLIEGTITFAQSSRPLLDHELSRAVVRGFSVKQIPIAIDGLGFAVHPDYPRTDVRPG